MSESLRYEESIHIEATPEEVYAVVSDIARTGEWSPVCEACWWDEGDGPRVGASFTGRNVTPERTWETRSQVISAEEGRSFGWSVGPGRVNWNYRMREVDGGTELTESWELTPVGQAYFVERFGEGAPAEVAEREAAARKGISMTLAALKSIIETV
ncbi:MAG: SRPBCC family protein [Leucobacter sp.]